MQRVSLHEHTHPGPLRDLNSVCLVYARVVMKTQSLCAVFAYSCVPVALALIFRAAYEEKKRGRRAGGDLASNLAARA
jgi:hypothetical protein